VEEGADEADLTVAVGDQMFHGLGYAAGVVGRYGGRVFVERPAGQRHFGAPHPRHDGQLRGIADRRQGQPTLANVGRESEVAVYRCRRVHCRLPGDAGLDEDELGIPRSAGFLDSPEDVADVEAAALGSETDDAACSRLERLCAGPNLALD
jgi:hypothetical protein